MYVPTLANPGGVDGTIVLDVWKVWSEIVFGQFGRCSLPLPKLVWYPFGVLLGGCC